MSKKSRGIQLSITEFAIPTPRFGSIESESGYGPLPMVGNEIHQEIQVERMREGGTYVVEKWVTHTFNSDPYNVTVSGRMDGMRYGSPTLIEEIKSSYAPEGLIERLQAFPEHPYLLQLRTYGYIQWLTSGHEPQLKLLVVCSRTRKISELDVALDVQAFEGWLKRRLVELNTEEMKFDVLKAKRLKQSGAMTFPFENPRPGQRELIDEIGTHLGSDTRALIQAPTGLGKTIGVLYPSLKQALERGQKTVYVTAKNSQHTVAEDAVERLQKIGCKIKSVTVHAKSKMCLKDEVMCNPTHCEYARDYYTKLDRFKLTEQLAKKKRLGEKTFKKIGQEFQVCPFELQLECIPRADVIVCDYNYVFSPRNILGRISHNGYGQQTKPNLVIDEAHNLAPRANDYFSAELDLNELRKLMEQSTFLPETLWEKLKSLYRGVETQMDQVADHGYGPHKIDPAQLQFEGLAAGAQELVRSYLETDLGLRTQDPVLRFSHMIQEFAEASVQVGDEFIFTRTPSPQGAKLKVTCCDASRKLAERYAEFANVVAFSATLKPFPFHLQLLGMDPNITFVQEFTSPFPKENRKILIIPQISTKMRDRENNYGKVKDTIEKVVSLRPGNYFAFFPSFDFLNRVAALIDLPDFRILRQERNMRRNQIHEYIEALKDPDQPTIIFAVQGGVFSEGVDYPGNMLIGAMIVGPALPVFDFERELLRKYFDEKGGSGFDYAYTFPAMTRVVQSAGRVIRSADDRGLIILMDRRFLSENYVNAMPSDWIAGGTEPLVSKQILQDVKEFWDEHESS